MKLHLPKGLLVAVLAVCCAASVSQALTIDSATNTAAEGDSWSKMFDPDKTAYYTTEQKVTSSSDKAQIVGGDGSIFFQTWKSNGCKDNISITGDIYVGRENGLRVGMDDYNVTLKNIYLTNDTSIYEYAGNTSHTVTITGVVTDHVPTDIEGETYDSTSTFTLNGGKYVFEGKVDVDGFEVKKRSLSNTQVTFAETSEVIVTNLTTDTTIINNGDLTINGDINLTASSLNDYDAIFGKGTGRFSKDGGANYGTNGFAEVEDILYYIVTSTAPDATLTVTNATSVTIGDKSYSLNTPEAGKLGFTVDDPSDISTVFHVNEGSESINYDAASAFVLNGETTVLDLSGKAITGHQILDIQGNGNVIVAFGTDNHSKSVQLDDDFTGVLSVKSGKMTLDQFSLHEDVVLELISGQNWHDTTFKNEILLNAANIDTAYDFAYSSVTLSGKVTGNYLRMSGEGDAANTLTLTNAANDIDKIKVQKGTLNIQNGKVGTVLITGGNGAATISDGEVTGLDVSAGRTDVSGGKIGYIKATAGEVNITGTTATIGIWDTELIFADTHVAGIYAKDTAVINIGDGENQSTVTAARVEMGDSNWTKVNGQNVLNENGGVLNIKSGATLVVTGSDIPSSASNYGYHSTGFTIAEWGAKTTVNVEGKLLAQNASVAVGDATGVINVENDGILAIKGLKSQKGNAGTMNLTLGDNGILILGSTGISGQNFSATLNAGEIAITEDTAISKNITLNSSTGTTFNTAKWVWADDGTDITRGTEGGNLTISGAISGSGKLVKTGAGTLTLGSANTYSGGTDISSGTLKITNADALGTGIVTVEKDATLEIAHTSGNSALNKLTSGVTLKEGAKISNTGSNIWADKEQLAILTLEGDATVDAQKAFGLVAKDNTETTLNLNGHQLTKEGSANFALLSTTIYGGGSLELKAGQFLIGYASQATTVTGEGVTVDMQGGTLVLENTSSKLVIGSLTGNSGEIANTGRIELGSTGEHSFGSTIRDAGTIAVTAAGKHSYTGTSNANKLELKTTGSCFAFAADAGEWEYSETISGVGEIHKTGAAALKVSGDNTYSGGTTIMGGVLKTAHANALGSGKVTVNGGLLELAADLSLSAMDILSGSVQNGAHTLSVSGVLKVGAGQELAAPATGGVNVGTLELENGASATMGSGLKMANLTLASGSSVTIHQTVQMGNPTPAETVMLGSSSETTSTGYTLSLEKGLTLKGNIVGDIKDLTPGSGEVVLFTGVDTLKLGDQTYNVGSQVLTSASGVKLTDYFSIEGINEYGNYYLAFDGNGSVIAGLNVPEPTTATLGLLALAGLCARRRRK